MTESKMLMSLSQAAHHDGGENEKPAEKGDDNDDADSTDDEGNEEGDMFGGFSSKGKRHRGKLPDWATTALTQWLWDHSAQPYPSEEEKTTLVAQTGLTLVQINNWFSNARRRILKKKHKSVHNQPHSELIFTQEKFPAAPPPGSKNSTPSTPNAAKATKPPQTSTTPSNGSVPAPSPAQPAPAPAVAVPPLQTTLSDAARNPHQMLPPISTLTYTLPPPATVAPKQKHSQ